MQYMTDYLMELYNVLPDVELPEFNLGTLGLILVTAGVVACVFQYIRGCDKRKGFRMVLKDRNDKKHAIWLEIIQDGIDGRVAKNEINQKEGNDMITVVADLVLSNTSINAILDDLQPDGMFLVVAILQDHAKPLPLVPATDVLKYT